MKKIIVFLFVIMAFIGCSNPSIAREQPSQLIGTWTSGPKAWEFTDYGVVTLYSTVTGEIDVYGFYIDYPQLGEVYMEEFYDGDSGTYLYEITYNLFGNHDLVLKMTPAWIVGANPTWWIKAE